MEPLTVEQKAALCLGAAIWHTVAVPEHGIASIMPADGPHACARSPDLEMPPNRGVSDRAIVDAVADGSLDEAVWTGRSRGCGRWWSGLSGSCRCTTRRR